MRKSFWHHYDAQNDAVQPNSEPDSWKWLYSEPVLDPYKLLGITSPNANFTKVKSPLAQAIDAASIA